MQLINKEDDTTLGFLHLGDNRLEALLKFAAELSAGNQGAEVKRQELFPSQAIRHVPGHNPAGKPFYNSGFTDARLTDQYGVVFGAARQYLHYPPDFFIAADNGVDFFFPGKFG